MSSSRPGSPRPRVVLVPGFTQTAASWRGVGADPRGVVRRRRARRAGARDVRGDRGRDRDAGRRARVRGLLDGRPARVCASRSTGPTSLQALVLVSATAGIADAGRARANAIASDEALAAVGRARRRRRVPRALARAAAVRDGPARRARARRTARPLGALPRALPARARRGSDGTDVGPARTSSRCRSRS